MNPSLKLPEPPPELANVSARLVERIVELIQHNGPMPFDRYMQMALYEPGLGYYVNGLHKFGAEGDFVTAPEQGSLFAMALAKTLQPVAERIAADWTLMEIGPGSGALARDLLEHLETPPSRYLLLETSAVLRDVQAETLTSLPEHLQARIEWIDAPPTEGFHGAIVANEVLDALPVKRFEITPQDVAELAVNWDGQRLGWHTTEPDQRLRTAFEHLQDDLVNPLPVGFCSEICVDQSAWLASVTRPLKSGLALMIDYGYPRTEYYLPERSAGTLVAHYRHRAHFDPFVWPGLNDLSAFVDFTALAEAAVEIELEVAGFSSQAGFVLGSGIAEELAAIEDPNKQLERSSELKKLVLPGEMGEKFKLMALTRNLADPLWEFTLSDQRHRL